MALRVGDIFSSIEVARDAISRFILDSGKSYMKETSNASIRSPVLYEVLAANSLSVAAF